jgi:uncharacterized protein (DUF1697 family)
MKTYIAFLRGINVSGKHIIKMEALKHLFLNLKMSDVKTYVQSGNVLFSANESDNQKLERKISVQIKKEFGYEVPTLVLNVSQMETIVKDNPFIKDKTKDELFFHVTMLAEEPKAYNSKIFEEKKLANEAIEIKNRAIYLYCPAGYGQTKLTNTFIENKLKVSATTRNWKTMKAVLELANT